MITSPSIDDMIEGVIIAIGNEMLPYLDNERAQATAVMAQSVLQGVRQLLEVQDEHLALDHNEMTAALRGAAEALGDVEGSVADRVRGRAATLGAAPDVGPPPDREAIIEQHRALGSAMEACLIDLDELQREGVKSADAAVDALRTAMAARYQRYVPAVMVGEGMIGRG